MYFFPMLSNDHRHNMQSPNPLAGAPHPIGVLLKNFIFFNEYYQGRGLGEP